MRERWHVQGLPQDHRAAALEALRVQSNWTPNDEGQPVARNAAIVHALLYVGEQIETLREATREAGGMQPRPVPWGHER
jgi:hypothetical protein